MSSSSTEVAHIIVSVVGFNAHGATYSSSSEGVGKSCLCSRFRYPGFDDYVPDHPSLLAFHEFESQVVSTDSFLYWGPEEALYTARGSKQGKVKEIKVKHEVLEHTVFYQDETSRPFRQHSKLLETAAYAKKAAQTPESSRKISYYARDAIGFPDRYTCLPYPSNPNKLQRGFIIAVDISLEGPRFEQQFTAVESIAYELRKSPLIIAATKRDIACQASLTRLSEWAAKQKLALIETSAKENINVSDAFRLVASKVLPKRINDHYMDYAGATGELITKRAAAKKELKNYLKTFVHTSSITLASLEATKYYQNGLNMLGKFTSDEIVCCHLLVIRNREIEDFSGVKDNPDMRLELLEDFIDSQTDFNAHKGMLNTMANHLVNPEQAVYANEGVGNSNFHHLLPSPMIDRKKDPAPSHNETEVLKNQQQQQQQQPTSPGKYVRLVSQCSDASVTGSTTTIDSTATATEEDGDTPLSTTQVGQALSIEEVYDDFTTPEGGPSEDTSLLSMKERAALLKKQFQGHSVAVNESVRPVTPPIQSSIQSKETFSSSSAGSSPAANKRLTTKRPPPAVPSKPSNYQKHKIKVTAPPPPPNEATCTSPPDAATGLPELASGPALPNKTQTSSPQHSLESKPQQFVPNEQHLTTEQSERQTESTLEKQDLPGAKHKDILELERQDSPLEDVAQSQLDKSKSEPSLEDASLVKDKLQEQLAQQITQSKSPRLDQRKKNYETKGISERKNYEKTKPTPPPPTTKPKRNDYEPKLPKLRQKHGITSGTPTTASDSPSVTNVTQSPTNVTQSLPVTTPPNSALSHPLPPPPPPQFVSAVNQPLPPPPPQANPLPFSPPTKDTMSSPPIHSMSMMSPPLDSSPTVVSHYPSLSSPPLLSPPVLSPPQSMVSPSSSVHFSPHSSVVSSPSHSVSSVQAVTTPHGRSPSPPPIPPHTAAMLKPREPESVKPSKRHNYFNIFKKLTGDSNDGKKPGDTPSTDNNTNSGRRRRTQVDMTRRPLPMEPLVKPVHGEEDYEKPDTFFERPRMPLPGESPGPYPLPVPLPGEQYPASVDPRMNSPFIVDPRFADPRVPGFDPLLMTTRNPYPYVIPNASVPANLWSTPNWFANRPSEQLLLSEHLQRLHAQQSNVPRRSQSFQVTGSRRVNHLDDDVDEDGYQNPDVVEDIRRERDLTSQWSVGPQQLPGRSIDYDYPELRGFRTVPRRSPQRSHQERPLPSRKPPRPLQKEDSYVNMDESSLADDYQNSDIINSMTDFVPQVRLPPRSKGGSMDDSFLYYNMRRRNILSPPLSPQRSMLPPRGSAQESGGSEIGIAPPSKNPTLVEQQKNSSPSLPPPLPAKSKGSTMSHSFSTSSIESGLSGPPLSRIPSLPPKDIKDLPPLPSKPESPGIDEETGQKKKIKLPPRNIPRPGFNNMTIQQQEYTTII